MIIILLYHSEHYGSADLSHVGYVLISWPETLSVIPSKKTKDILGGWNLCKFCFPASTYSVAMSPTDLSPNCPSPTEVEFQQLSLLASIRFVPFM